MKNRNEIELDIECDDSEGAMIWACAISDEPDAALKQMGFRHAAAVGRWFKDAGSDQEYISLLKEIYSVFGDIRVRKDGKKRPISLEILHVKET